MTAIETIAYDVTDLDLGFYSIEVGPSAKTFRWLWFEKRGTRADDSGSWYNTRSAALRAAAGNWDSQGSGGNLSLRLREAAVNAERAEHPPTGERIIPTEVRVVSGGSGPGYERPSEHGARIAAHLCEVWGWLPDEPEAHDLGNRAASALTHAVAGSRTSAESLISTLLCIPSGKAPQEVYAQALADVRAALIAANPTNLDTALAAASLPNPHPTYDRS